MSARAWLGYGTFAAISTLVGIVLWAAVLLPGPPLVVAGSVGVIAAAAARRGHAGAIVRGAAALSAAGLAGGWLLWLFWRAGVW